MAKPGGGEQQDMARSFAHRNAVQAGVALGDLDGDGVNVAGDDPRLGPETMRGKGEEARASADIGNVGIGAAVIREPVDWLGSWYRYRQRPGMEGHRNSTHDISFDDFVLAYMKGQRPGFANVGSQFKFLERQPNGTGVTHLFRYEDQAGLQTFLQDRLGVTFELGQENVSPARDLNLSADVEKRFRRKFAEEFALYDGIPVR